MKIAIHQPNFLPWRGYFNKWSKVDLFVLLDDVKYSHNNWINRNRIAKQWLTVPVYHKHSSHLFINDIRICNELDWQRKMIATLLQTYGKAGVGEILNINFFYLVELNIALLQWAASKLDITIPLVRSSGMYTKGTGTERLVSICKSCNADEYVSGAGGMNYQEEAMFADSNITLTVLPNFQKNQTKYGKNFIPNLSVIDWIYKK
jgi:hypothetical protein